MASHDILTRSKTGTVSNKTPVTTEQVPLSTTTMQTVGTNSENFSNTSTTTTVTVSACTTQMSARLSPSMLRDSRSTIPSQTFPKTYEDELPAVFDRFEQYRRLPLPGYQIPDGEIEPPMYRQAGNPEQRFPASLYRNRQEIPETRPQLPISMYQGTAANQYIGYRPPMAAGDSGQSFQNVRRASCSPQLTTRPGLVHSTSNTTRSSPSVRMQLPKFNGKNKWSTFIRQFEAIASTGGWL